MNSRSSRTHCYAAPCWFSRRVRRSSMTGIARLYTSALRYRWTRGQPPPLRPIEPRRGERRRRREAARQERRAARRAPPAPSRSLPGPADRSRQLAEDREPIGTDKIGRRRSSRPRRHRQGPLIPRGTSRASGRSARPRPQRRPPPPRDRASRHGRRGPCPRGRLHRVARTRRVPRKADPGRRFRRCCSPTSPPSGAGLSRFRYGLLEARRWTSPLVE